MKVERLSAAVLLSMSASIALADTYQLEVGGAFWGTEYGRGLAFAGEGHFSPVNTSGHPLAEAAFLERSSNIFFAHQLFEDDDYGRDEVTSLELEYYVPHSLFYIGAGYQEFSYEDGWYEGNDWNVTLGLTPADGLLLTTTYENEEGYNLNLGARYFTALNHGTGLGLRAEYWSFDWDDRIHLEADYYLDSTLSFGVIVEKFGYTRIGAQAQKFFNPAFSGWARYVFGDSDSINSWDLGLSFRF